MRSPDSVSQGRGRAIVAVLGLIVAWSALSLGCKPSPTAPIDASPVPSRYAAASPAPIASAEATTVPATPRDASTKDAAATDAAATLPADAGASSCRLVYGPVQQSWRGPAALRVGKDGVDVVFNDDGAPRTLHVAGGPIDANAPIPKAKPDAATGEVTTAMGSPCAFGGDYVFCPNKAGDVLRTPRTGGASKTVGANRSGAHIDATTLAGGHALMAYLASRKTTEGWVSEAWAVLDDAPAVRVSEDGAGATGIDLAPRGSSVVAMMIDARRASTQVHARVITLGGNKLAVGPDAVVFIGGPGERGTAAAIATPADGAGYVLLPISQDVSTFGVATIHIDDVPKIDALVTWSMYPNGLDPAPLAATQGHTPMRVARVRPLAAEASSARGLEIGRLGIDGTFVSQGYVPTHGTATDLAVDVDGLGALWLFYTDMAGSWLERRVCP